MEYPFVEYSSIIIALLSCKGLQFLLKKYEMQVEAYSPVLWETIYTLQIKVVPFSRFGHSRDLSS